MENRQVNEFGHLVLGGIDVKDLISTYGTPLYILEEDKILKACREFKNAIDGKYSGLVVYASKALNCLELCRIMEREGLGVDVVSGGELYTALQAGVNPKNIVFHGNNKSQEELKMAIENNIGRIVLDNMNELKNIVNISNEIGIKANVMPRLKPGIDVHTHDYIKTGQIDCKFGFAIENEEAFNMVKEVIKYKCINLVGFHCHIGSQIFEVEPFEDAAEIMLNFINKIRLELGIIVTDLNLGGGFGITYTNEDDPPKYSDFINGVYDRVNKVCSKLKLPIPYILIEPGRAIVGEAGTTLYTVGAIKEILGIRKYVSIDGGMSDNPRYALYNAKHDIVNALKMNKPKDSIITLAGKCCESGDLIGENMSVQNVEIGDIIAVFSTGAYNYSMASNYNRLPRPPIVMVKDGKSRVIVKKETYYDICKNDI